VQGRGGRLSGVPKGELEAGRGYLLGQRHPVHDPAHAQQQPRGCPAISTTAPCTPCAAMGTALNSNLTTGTCRDRGPAGGTPLRAP